MLICEGWEILSWVTDSLDRLQQVSSESFVIFVIYCLLMCVQCSVGTLADFWALLLQMPKCCLFMFLLALLSRIKPPACLVPYQLSASHHQDRVACVERVAGWKSPESEITVVLSDRLERRQSRIHSAEEHVLRMLYTGHSRLTCFVFYYFSAWHLHAPMHYWHALKNTGALWCLCTNYKAVWGCEEQGVKDCEERIDWNVLKY